MFRKKTLCLLLAAGCLLGLVGGVGAAEVSCDAQYCFTQADFSDREDLRGICITALPDASAGTVMLDARVICVGDILTTEQVEKMTFVPLQTESDTQATVTFLPIYDDRVEKAATMTISIRGKKDEAPVAQDQTLETYKNLPNSASLQAKDPEGQALVYTITRQPKRGTVEIGADGTFTYTPKKNKVGTDSFVYTATDPAGNVSREATVTITVLKPADKTQYSDTVGTSCRFEAEWLKNTGVFTGEQVNGQYVFHPERNVSRGEFLAMAVKVLGIPVDDTQTADIYTDEVPAWLQPYLAAAIRSGLTAGLPVSDSGAFGAEQTITVAEAAVILQNALDLSVSAGAIGQAAEEVPEWAAAAVAAMAENGIVLSAAQDMTRSEAARLLYRISALAEAAPGMQIYQ